VLNFVNSFLFTFSKKNILLLNKEEEKKEIDGSQIIKNQYKIENKKQQKLTKCKLYAIFYPWNEWWKTYAIPLQ